MKTAACLGELSADLTGVRLVVRMGSPTVAWLVRYSVAPSAWWKVARTDVHSAESTEKMMAAPTELTLAGTRVGCSAAHWVSQMAGQWDSLWAERWASQ